MKILKKILLSVGIVSLGVIVSVVPCFALGYRDNYVMLYNPDNIRLEYWTDNSTSYSVDISPDKYVTNQDYIYHVDSVGYQHLPYASIMYNTQWSSRASHNVGLSVIDSRVQYVFRSIGTTGDYWNTDGAPFASDTAGLSYGGYFTENMNIIMEFDNCFVDVSNTGSLNDWYCGLTYYYTDIVPTLPDIEVFADILTNNSSISFDLYTRGGYKSFTFKPNIVITNHTNESADLFISLEDSVRSAVASVTDTSITNNLCYISNVRVNLRQLGYDMNGAFAQPDGFTFTYGSASARYGSYTPLSTGFEFENVVEFETGSFFDWVINSVGAFFNAEIIPGVKLGIPVTIIIVVGTALWILKVFAGG